MKRLNYLSLVLFFVVISVSAQQKVAKNSKTSYKASDYVSFGDKFQLKNVLTEKQMLKKYQSLKKGDTISVNYASEIKAVCQKKGCWMEMDLTNENKSFVKFKDYGFFVPLNAGNSQAIVSGKAFVDVVSVSELKHYAKDAGKSEAEINKITKPKTTYSFLANGVLIKK